MPSAQVPPREFEPPTAPKFTILAIDGGGIRGLIPAMLLERLEQLLAEHDPEATLAAGFDLIAGTSTGGLIALGLTTPDERGAPVMDAGAMVELYSGPEAAEIFARPPLRQIPGVSQISDLLDPRYSLDGLREVLERRFGEATLGQALTGLLITSYDMHSREPRFLKRWQPSAASISAVEAGLATSAAPTYFPPSIQGEAALVDGGVFVNNPTIAATIEALKRVEGEPLRPEDLLVVSLGTGQHETGFEADEVAGWGALGWVLPKPATEPPLVGAMLDGQSDASHHWAHVLLNHTPGTPMQRGADLGAGPRYFRFQIELPEPLALDGIEPAEIERLTECGAALRDGREDELAALAAALTA